MANIIGQGYPGGNVILQGYGGTAPAAPHIYIPFNDPTPGEGVLTEEDPTPGLGYFTVNDPTSN